MGLHLKNQENFVRHLNKTSHRVFLWLFPLWVLFVPLAWGGAGQSGHGHHPAEPPKKNPDDIDGHSHSHSRWVSPPANYAGKRGTHWFDPEAITHGEALYQTHCVACHGKDGRGAGELAARLEHPPADLTKHFHSKPGKNDDYLFWRVSEGGTAEPFAAMKSAMPAFKSVMNEKERWSVLAYVHNRYHQNVANMCIQAEGVLEVIHQDKRKVSIRHEAIAALGWPAMRMDFSVKPEVDMKSLKTGQKIRFCLMKSGEYEYAIAGILPAH